MIRFNNGILVNNFKNNLFRQEKAVFEQEEKIQSRQKYLHPHENPIDVKLGMVYRSAVSEYQRYEGNINIADSKYEFVDDQLGQISDYMGRIHELLVKGANATYNADDRSIIANEVDEYLRQIIQVANSTDYDGKTIFSGNATNITPFELSEAKVEGAGRPLVSKVEYRGDYGKQYTEISRGEYIETAFNGNEVFWANNMKVKSNTESTNYIADRDQKIRVNGIEIGINEGDNLETVIDKINSTNVAVKGEVVMKESEKYVALEGSTPHEMWLEDIGGGTVLQDLGLIAKGGSNPPGNYEPSAEVYSESVFDKIIKARDALYDEGAYQTGNTIDGVLDDSIGHIADYRALVGTKHARIKRVSEHVSESILEAQEMHTKFVGMDDVETARAFADFKYLESVRNATLQMGARLIPRSLLDFLR